MHFCRHVLRLRGNLGFEQSTLAAQIAQPLALLKRLQNASDDRTVRARSAGRLPWRGCAHRLLLRRPRHLRVLLYLRFGATRLGARRILRARALCSVSVHDCDSQRSGGGRRVRARTLLLAAAAFGGPLEALSTSKSLSLSSSSAMGSGSRAGGQPPTSDPFVARQFEKTERAQKTFS